MTLLFTGNLGVLAPLVDIGVLEPVRGGVPSHDLGSSARSDSVSSKLRADGFV